MNLELHVIDTLATEQSDIAAAPEMIKLDDLSLALVGGGGGMVDLG